MTEFILKTNELTRTYNSFNALDNVSITLEPGKIYGLIGRNGAGKSTLMRVIAGLSYPTSGSMELFGKKSAKAIQAERKRIGSMIESPSLIMNMTAKENMKAHRTMRGIPNTEIEDELLHLVGLSDTGKKKVKDFSLGMKQRLGIAISLINNPELLILDEPINGLDPLGVKEVRNLLIKLCEERHITILISSHNLPELFQVATDYIIIHDGEIKQTLTLEQLENRCRKHILIECEEPEKLLSILETEFNTTNFKVLPDKTVKLYEHVDEKKKVAQALLNHGILTTNFSIEGDTLENYFISVIGGEEE
ncbi:ATP-binding cassette domain-containing protein [Bacillus atrophaeus]|uniref:ABC transporter ATP-binding protein n=1 Tax=Bacillus atrophaeus TaxID=1452 RepID=UPI002282FFA3|nr:ATP-binding cassette domain-containing protein [Bacillus atrophaeus]MCY7948224.1 ATP-binding cassette domain-containing protein [Bacillus atrophaeus]MCY8095803.1 ATP-binding cassette domain-containing protein [Bacillus atrophaeus]MCY9170448.1 ATP-binding cassette domain-containing protein [Bacillus atrophaeus]MEC0739496.1 ATP-binding cassette domain-containing protein [Bacillus atrophaeus]MEC0747844.1 ATP-binding cassette domain-containing protein [Bacillus atrophaeus]